MLWVVQYLCSMSLLHCDVGWLVFVFYSPSTLCCQLVGICALCPFYTVLWLVSVCVLCPFYTVLLVGQCLCSASLLHCVVGRSVFMFYFTTTL